MSADLIGSITCDHFVPLVGTEFVLEYAPGQELVLTLKAAERTKSGPAKPDLRHPFVLTFQGASRTSYVPQGSYPIAHATLGSMTLFIVPIGPEDQGMLYEAVFT